MSVTTTCRDLNELTPAAQLACRLLFQECYKAGITDVFITETYRSQARQNYLYEQGRTRLYDANGKKLSKVTWTKSSNHTSRRAWDIAVAPLKDLYDKSTLNKVGAIAKKLNITWGGTWAANYDAPHFEIGANWTAPAGYKLEGTVIVPSNSKLNVQLIIADKQQAIVGVNDGKRYRVQSGTFHSQAAAENAKKLMDAYGIANKTYTRVYQDGTVWRVLTGTYTSHAVALEAIREMQNKKVLQTATAVVA